MINEKRESQIFFFLTCVDGKAGPRGSSRPSPAFDQQSFVEAIVAIVAIIVQVSVVAATTVQWWAREGRVISKGFRHIILQHT